MKIKQYNFSVLQLLLCSACCYTERYWKDLCGQQLFLNANSSLSLKLKETVKFTDSKCIIQLRTNSDYLIRANLRYVPKGTDCKDSYLHVGNDEYRLDTTSVTSFKFCYVIWDLEIVSRDSYLWIIFVHQRKSNFPRRAEISFKVQKKISTCSDDEFRCSPVQCIPISNVCDNKIDCENRRDEYCLQSPPEGINLKPVCFECDDGTCINPVLPFYDEDHDKPLSFLCDGYNHCPDGTDERKDMCFRTKSKVSDLLTCVPKDARFGYNTTVRMWQDRICDSKKDCISAEDERSCVREVKANIDVDNNVIIILACAGSLLLAWIAVFTYRIRRKNQQPIGEFGDGTTSRSRIYQSRDSQNQVEVCRLQTVSEEPENVKWA